MRVRMKTLSAGPDGVHREGHVYDMTEHDAHALVRGGHAEYADPAPAADEADEPAEEPEPPKKKGRKAKAADEAAAEEIDETKPEE